MQKTEATEAQARRAAQRAGLKAIKSRRATSADNLGGFMLIDPQRNAVVAGERFDLEPRDVLTLCK